MTAATTDTTADHPLDRGVPCIRCRYDLRGQDDAGRCPECGLPAYWTLRAPQNLAQFPPGWVTAMAWGARLIALAYAAVFVVFVAASLQWIPDGYIETTIVSSVMSASVLQAIGMWLLACHSRHASEPRRPINRWILRIASLAGVAAAGAMARLQLGWDYSVYYVMLAALVATWFAPPAAFVRLRSVARLFAKPSLAEHAAIVAWGFALTPIAWVAMMIPGMMGRRLDMSEALPLILMAVLCAGVLLFLLWGAAIMTVCLIDFGRAARIARAEWRSAGQAPD
jgi:hypothetical protein